MSDPFSRIRLYQVNKKRREYIRLAQAAKLQRDWVSAIDFYAKALSMRETFGTRVQLAHMLKEAGRLDEAEGMYLKALSKNPDDPDLNLQIGHFYWVMGDPQKSHDFYERAASLAPDDIQIRDNLRIGTERLADAPYQEAVDLGMRAMSRGEWQVAEQCFRKPYANNLFTHALVLAHAVKEQGRLEEAVEIYGKYRAFTSNAGGKLAYEGELQFAGALQLSQRFSEAAVHFAAARQLRLEQEGWVGSVDELMEQIRICVRQVHPAIDTSLLR